MSTKIKWQPGNVLRFFDRSTFELLDVAAARKLVDDFDVAVNATNWTEVDTNAATKALTAGILQYHLHAANDQEEAGIYGADLKLWNIDKGLIVQFVAAVHIAPTLNGEFVLGVTNDSYGADDMRVFVSLEQEKFAGFGFYTTVGAGLIPCMRTYDGTADSGVVSSGVTVVLDAYHVFTIDFTSSASVQFFIDGVRVGGSTTFKMNTAAALTVQPIAMACKHDNAASLGDLYVDSIKIWQPNR